MLLEKLAIQLLPEVRQRFQNYASEVHASRRSNGWASLRAGAVEKYVACFDSMAETLARECLREKAHQPEALILLIMNVIEQAIRSSETSPTDPWMPEELFTDDKFRVAMTTMIEAKLKQLEPRLFREGPMRKADNQSHSSTRKTPAQDTRRIQNS